jgi:CxxC motif-containing protein (DUF1111 family)
VNRSSKALWVLVLIGVCALFVCVSLLTGGDSGSPSSTARGRELFTAEFTAEQGLGPLFNDRSCAGCHLEPAAGGVGRNGLATVVRVGRLTTRGFVIGSRGPVAPGHSISELGVACDLQAGIPAGVNVTSVRNAPPLFGSGLVDSIPAAVIRAGAVAKVDGVRGRPNLVRGPDGRERVGRFGWKAHVPTLELFVAEAFRSELGLTSPLAPAVAPDSSRVTDGPCAEKSAASEVDRDALTAVVAFLASLPAPEPQDSRSAGAMVFQQTGCAVCHVPTLRARTREVALYSDLLLHDMGRALDDGVVQGSAAGAEWRTTPLWGLSDRSRFLHDGRARSVEAAIRDHGGEAQRASRRFHSLSAERRRSLLAFLESL